MNNDNRNSVSTYVVVSEQDIECISAGVCDIREWGIEKELSSVVRCDCGRIPS